MASTRESSVYNLMIKDALRVVKPTMDKVKVIVEFFHKSTVATEKLKSMQWQMGMPELRPKQKCATRWNSTFHMLKRILESKDAIISTLAVINAPVVALNREEWETVKVVCTVPEPFQEVTVEISAERYLEQFCFYLNNIQLNIAVNSKILFITDKFIDCKRSNGSHKKTKPFHKISKNGVQHRAFRNHCTGPTV